MLNRVIRKVRKLWQLLNRSYKVNFPLSQPLPLPPGINEQQLFDFVTSIRVEDGPEAEMRTYATQDFRRFVYTYGLTNGISGKCLELGANPYFTTMLLKQFTSLELSLSNYFGPSLDKESVQRCRYRDFTSGRLLSVTFAFQHFNVEEDPFPYEAETFDVVIFAEIIEHLLKDPCKALREIKRVLRPGGKLILTTPNVARLENIARLIAGDNIYDPYSGYGPYGRHNREYTCQELIQLLTHEGFLIDTFFTANVHDHSTPKSVALNGLAQLVRFRRKDLGQYIFIKATNHPGSETNKRPSWLYRSYPDNQLE